MTILRRIFICVLVLSGLTGSAFAQYTPTITGANAFWWLGSGILADGGMCSGQTGPCYFAQSQLTPTLTALPGVPYGRSFRTDRGK
ncbi:MAG TPA: hypothetical protein VFW83_03505 [Bryobacteraceae bacterium]|nr:hypothetical protein [Bryobacteraceae bacterium]